MTADIEHFCITKWTGYQATKARDREKQITLDKRFMNIRHSLFFGSDLRWVEEQCQSHVDEEVRT